MTNITNVPTDLISTVPIARITIVPTDLILNWPNSQHPNVPNKSDNNLLIFRACSARVPPPEPPVQPGTQAVQASLEVETGSQRRPWSPGSLWLSLQGLQGGLGLQRLQGLLRGLEQIRT